MPPAKARLLGRIGFVCKRPKVVPVKAGAWVRQAFLDVPLTAAAEAVSTQPGCV
jgi:hypothetical protein